MKRSGSDAAPFLLHVSLLLAVGCQRKESAATATSTAEPDAEVFEPQEGANKVTIPIAPVFPTNCSVPFRGVIKAKEQRDLLLNGTEITYTTGDRKIRRKTARIAPLGKLADLDRGAVGIICDLDTERVVLCRCEDAKMRFLRMTLSEYQELVADTSASQGAGERTLALLAVRPSFWRHVGTFFFDIPRPVPDGHAVDLPHPVGGGILDLIPPDVVPHQRNERVVQAFAAAAVARNVQAKTLERIRKGAGILTRANVDKSVPSRWQCERWHAGKHEHTYRPDTLKKLAARQAHFRRRPPRFVLCHVGS